MECALGASVERVLTTSWPSMGTWRLGLLYDYTKSLSNLHLYDDDRHLTGLRASVGFQAAAGDDSGESDP